MQMRVYLTDIDPPICEDLVTAPSANLVMGPHAEPIRVVVVDDHELFRNGLVEMLSERGIAVAGVAGSGEEALESIPRLRPDVALMDLSLPGISGVDVTRRLSAQLPGTCVVALTVMADEETLLQAILAGACGYLLKDESIDEIVAGVQAAARGDGVIAPQLTRSLMRRIQTRHAGTAPLARLTARERQVLDLLVEGCDNAEIAERLYISQSTAKNHVASILVKLGVHNRLQAAVLAVRGRI
jgi:two-component system response regulator DevR